MFILAQTPSHVFFRPLSLIITKSVGLTYPEEVFPFRFQLLSEKWKLNKIRHLGEWHFSISFENRVELGKSNATTTDNWFTSLYAIRRRRRGVGGGRRGLVKSIMKDRHLGGWAPAPSFPPFDDTIKSKSTPELYTDVVSVKIFRLFFVSKQWIFFFYSKADYLLRNRTNLFA